MSGPEVARPAGSSPSGRLCPPVQFGLVILGMILLIFGFFYVLAPATAISSVDTLASQVGVKTLPPTEPNSYDRSWLIFTFAYMMGATACCFLTLVRPDGRLAYLEILLLLKSTSSLTGLAFFLALNPYGFYLATFITDGVIFLAVLAIYLHIRRAHTPGSASLSRNSEPGPNPEP